MFSSLLLLLLVVVFNVVVVVFVAAAAVVVVVLLEANFLSCLEQGRRLKNCEERNTKCGREAQRMKASRSLKRFEVIAAGRHGSSVAANHPIYVVARLQFNKKHQCDKFFRQNKYIFTMHIFNLIWLSYGEAYTSLCWSFACWKSGKPSSLQWLMTGVVSWVTPTIEWRHRASVPWPRVVVRLSLADHQLAAKTKGRRTDQPTNQQLSCTRREIGWNGLWFFYDIWVPDPTMREWGHATTVGVPGSSAGAGGEESWCCSPGGDNNDSATDTNLLVAWPRPLSLWWQKLQLWWGRCFQLMERIPHTCVVWSMKDIFDITQ